MKLAKLSLIAVLAGMMGVAQADDAFVNLSATVIGESSISITDNGNFDLRRNIDVTDLSVGTGSIYSNQPLGYTVDVTATTGNLENTGGITIPYYISYSQPAAGVDMRNISFAGVTTPISLVDSNTITAGDESLEVKVTVYAADFATAPADVYSDTLKFTITAK